MSIEPNLSLDDIESHITAAFSSLESYIPKDHTDSILSPSQFPFYDITQKLTNDILQQRNIPNLHQLINLLAGITPKTHLHRFECQSRQQLCVNSITDKDDMRFRRKFHKNGQITNHSCTMPYPGEYIFLISALSVPLRVVHNMALFSQIYMNYEYINNYEELERYNNAINEYNQLKIPVSEEKKAYSSHIIQMSLNTDNISLYCDIKATRQLYYHTLILSILQVIAFIPLSTLSVPFSTVQNSHISRDIYMPYLDYIYLLLSISPLPHTNIMLLYILNIYNDSILYATILFNNDDDDNNKDDNDNNGNNNDNNNNKKNGNISYNNTIISQHEYILLLIECFINSIIAYSIDTNRYSYDLLITNNHNNYTTFNNNNNNNNNSSSSNNNNDTNNNTNSTTPLTLSIPILNSLCAISPLFSVYTTLNSLTTTCSRFKYTIPSVICDVLFPSLPCSHCTQSSHDPHSLYTYGLAPKHYIPLLISHSDPIPITSGAYIYNESHPIPYHIMASQHKYNRHQHNNRQHSSINNTYEHNSSLKYISLILSHCATLLSSFIYTTQYATQRQIKQICIDLLIDKIELILKSCINTSVVDIYTSSSSSSSSLDATHHCLIANITTLYTYMILLRENYTLSYKDIDSISSSSSSPSSPISLSSSPVSSLSSVLSPPTTDPPDMNSINDKSPHTMQDCLLDAQADMTDAISQVEVIMEPNSHISPIFPEKSPLNSVVSHLINFISSCLKYSANSGTILSHCEHMLSNDVSNIHTIYTIIYISLVSYRSLCNNIDHTPRRLILDDLQSLNSIKQFSLFVSSLLPFIGIDTENLCMHTSVPHIPSTLYDESMSLIVELISTKRLKSDISPSVTPNLGKRDLCSLRTTASPSPPTGVSQLLARLLSPQFNFDALVQHYDSIIIPYICYCIGLHQDIDINISTNNALMSQHSYILSHKSSILLSLSNLINNDLYSTLQLVQESLCTSKSLESLLPECSIITKLFNTSSDARDTFRSQTPASLPSSSPSPSSSSSHPFRTLYRCQSRLLLSNTDYNIHSKRDENILYSIEYLIFYLLPYILIHTHVSKYVDLFINACVGSSLSSSPSSSSLPSSSSSPPRKNTTMLSIHHMAGLYASSALFSSSSLLSSSLPSLHWSSQNPLSSSDWLQLCSLSFDLHHKMNAIQNSISAVMSEIQTYFIDIQCELRELYSNNNNNNQRTINTTTNTTTTTTNITPTMTPTDPLLHSTLHHLDNINLDQISDLVKCYGTQSVDVIHALLSQYCDVVYYRIYMISLPALSVPLKHNITYDISSIKTNPLSCINAILTAHYTMYLLVNRNNSDDTIAPTILLGRRYKDRERTTGEFFRNVGTNNQHITNKSSHKGIEWGEITLMTSNKLAIKSLSGAIATLRSHYQMIQLETALCTHLHPNNKTSQLSPYHTLRYSTRFHEALVGLIPHLLKAKHFIPETTLYKQSQLLSSLLCDISDVEKQKQSEQRIGDMISNMKDIIKSEKDSSTSMTPPLSSSLSVQPPMILPSDTNPLTQSILNYPDISLYNKNNMSDIYVSSYIYPYLSQYNVYISSIFDKIRPILQNMYHSIYNTNDIPSNRTKSTHQNTYYRDSSIINRFYDHTTYLQSNGYYQRRNNVIPFHVLSQNPYILWYPEMSLYLPLSMLPCHSVQLAILTRFNRLINQNEDKPHPILAKYNSLYTMHTSIFDTIDKREQIKIKILAKNEQLIASESILGDSEKGIQNNVDNDENISHAVLSHSQYKLSRQKTTPRSSRHLPILSEIKRENHDSRRTGVIAPRVLYHEYDNDDDETIVVTPLSDAIPMKTEKVLSLTKLCTTMNCNSEGDSNNDGDDDDVDDDPYHSENTILVRHHKLKQYDKRNQSMHRLRNDRRFMYTPSDIILASELSSDDEQIHSACLSLRHSSLPSSSINDIYNTSLCDLILSHSTSVFRTAHIDTNVVYPCIMWCNRYMPQYMDIIELFTTMLSYNYDHGRLYLSQSTPSSVSVSSINPHQTKSHLILRDVDRSMLTLCSEISLSSQDIYHDISRLFLHIEQYTMSGATAIHLSPISYTDKDTDQINDIKCDIHNCNTTLPLSVNPSIDINAISMYAKYYSYLICYHKNIVDIFVSILSLQSNIEPSIYSDNNSDNNLRQCINTDYIHFIMSLLTHIKHIEYHILLWINSIQYELQQQQQRQQHHHQQQIHDHSIYKSILLCIIKCPDINTLQQDNVYNYLYYYNLFSSFLEDCQCYNQQYDSNNTKNNTNSTIVVGTIKDINSNHGDTFSSSIDYDDNDDDDIATFVDNFIVSLAQNQQEYMNKMMLFISYHDVIISNHSNVFLGPKELNITTAADNQSIFTENSNHNGEAQIIQDDHRVIVEDIDQRGKAYLAELMEEAQIDANKQYKSRYKYSKSRILDSIWEKGLNLSSLSFHSLTVLPWLLARLYMISNQITSPITASLSSSPYPEIRLSSLAICLDQSVNSLLNYVISYISTHHVISQSEISLHKWCITLLSSNFIPLSVHHNSSMKKTASQLLFLFMHLTADCDTRISLLHHHYPVLEMPTDLKTKISNISKEEQQKLTITKPHILSHYINVSSCTPAMLHRDSPPLSAWFTSRAINVIFTPLAIQSDYRHSSYTYNIRDQGLSLDTNNSRVSSDHAGNSPLSIDDAAYRIKLSAQYQSMASIILIRSILPHLQEMVKYTRLVTSQYWSSSPSLLSQPTALLYSLNFTGIETLASLYCAVAPLTQVCTSLSSLIASCPINSLSFGSYELFAQIPWCITHIQHDIGPSLLSTDIINSLSSPDIMASISKVFAQSQYSALFSFEQSSSSTVPSSNMPLICIVLQFIVTIYNITLNYLLTHLITISTIFTTKEIMLKNNNIYIQNSKIDLSILLSPSSSSTTTTTTTTNINLFEDLIFLSIECLQTIQIITTILRSLHIIQTISHHLSTPSRHTNNNNTINASDQQANKRHQQQQQQIKQYMHILNVIRDTICATVEYTLTNITTIGYIIDRMMLYAEYTIYSRDLIIYRENMSDDMKQNGYMKQPRINSIFKSLFFPSFYSRELFGLGPGHNSSDGVKDNNTNNNNTNTPQSSFDDDQRQQQQQPSHDQYSTNYTHDIDIMTSEISQNSQFKDICFALGGIITDMNIVLNIDSSLYCSDDIDDATAANMNSESIFPAWTLLRRYTILNTVLTNDIVTIFTELASKTAQQRRKKSKSVQFDTAQSATTSFDRPGTIISMNGVQVSAPSLPLQKRYAQEVLAAISSIPPKVRAQVLSQRTKQQSGGVIGSSLLTVYRSTSTPITLTSPLDHNDPLTHTLSHLFLSLSFPQLDMSTLGYPTPYITSIAQSHSRRPYLLSEPIMEYLSNPRKYILLFGTIVSSVLPYLSSKTSQMDNNCTSTKLDQSHNPMLFTLSVSRCRDILLNTHHRLVKALSPELDDQGSHNISPNTSASLQSAYDTLPSLNLDSIEKSIVERMDVMQHIINGYSSSPEMDADSIVCLSRCNNTIKLPHIDSDGFNVLVPSRTRRSVQRSPQYAPPVAAISTPNSTKSESQLRRSTKTTPLGLDYVQNRTAIEIADDDNDKNTNGLYMDDNDDADDDYDDLAQMYTDYTEQYTTSNQSDIDQEELDTSLHEVDTALRIASYEQHKRGGGSGISMKRDAQSSSSISPRVVRRHSINTVKDNDNYNDNLSHHNQQFDRKDASCDNPVTDSKTTKHRRSSLEKRRPRAERDEMYITDYESYPYYDDTANHATPVRHTHDYQHPQPYPYPYQHPAYVSPHQVWYPHHYHAPALTPDHRYPYPYLGPPPFHTPHRQLFPSDEGMVIQGNTNLNEPTSKPNRRRSTLTPSDNILPHDHSRTRYDGEITQPKKKSKAEQPVAGNTDYNTDDTDHTPRYNGTADFLEGVELTTANNTPIKQRKRHTKNAILTKIADSDISDTGHVFDTPHSTRRTRDMQLNSSHIGYQQPRPRDIYHESPQIYHSRNDVHPGYPQQHFIYHPGTTSQHILMSPDGYHKQYTQDPSQSFAFSAASHIPYTPINYPSAPVEFHNHDMELYHTSNMLSTPIYRSSVGNKEKYTQYRGNSNHSGRKLPHLDSARTRFNNETDSDSN